MFTRLPFSTRFVSASAALGLFAVAACSPQVQDADTVVATEAPYESADDADPLPAGAPGVGVQSPMNDTGDLDGGGDVTGADAIDGEVGSPETSPGDQTTPEGDAPANRATEGGGG
ncbi:MAG: hypothetical protein AAF291_15180 [Pseudomonadota bacterium]